MAALVCVNPSVTAYAVPAPRPGSLFIANQQLSPRAGKVARSAERGAAKNSRMPRVIPPQLRLRSAAPPFHGGAFGCAVQTQRTVPYPFAERSFQWGYGGCRGPKGRNRNPPRLPCKKVIKKLPSLLFISTPQSRLTPCQLPGRGVLTPSENSLTANFQLPQ